MAPVTPLRAAQAWSPESTQELPSLPSKALMWSQSEGSLSMRRPKSSMENRPCILSPTHKDLDLRKWHNKRALLHTPPIGAQPRHCREDSHGEKHQEGRAVIAM